MNEFEKKNLINWFLEEQRDLPWRKNSTPYRVWVSEVMLQQTRVSVVIPYFEKWMQLFPTIHHLAAAPLDAVIKAWEGLGYYSRARNLHLGAKQLVREHAGILPQKESELTTIKGLGPYTIGAIQAFAFRQRAAAVDGNVMRVLSRYYAIKDDISKSKTIKYIRNKTLEILPADNHWIFSEALIELGATICMKKPQCAICPLRKTCQGYLQRCADKLPFKAPKMPITALYRAVAVTVAGNYCLVKRGAKGEIMSDLHEFPYFETEEIGWSASYLQQQLEKLVDAPMQFIEELACVKQSFTRYSVSLKPVIFVSPTTPAVRGFQWLSLEELEILAFSSGHKKIFDALKKNITKR